MVTNRITKPSKENIKSNIIQKAVSTLSNFVASFSKDYDRVGSVFEMDLSRKSRAVNAALAGMGRTRRIILADTLLRRFTTDEIEIVIAHELGHHQRGHLLKGMALQSAMVFLFLFLD